MGASQEEYTRLAPQHSFIHVDQFRGPKELAQYLLELDTDDQKYNEYFQVVNLFEEVERYPCDCSLHSVMTECLPNNKSHFTKQWESNHSEPPHQPSHYALINV